MDPIVRPAEGARAGPEVPNATDLGPFGTSDPPPLRRPSSTLAGVLGFLEGLLDRLGELGPVALHLLVGGLAFAETALFLDLLVPGEAGMVLVGAAGHRAELPLWGLVVAGSLGAVVGDSASYCLGRAVGAERIPGSQRLVRRAGRSLDRAEAFFARSGGRAVFLGRWVGALRAVVPFAAGLARMPYRRFLLWNVAASLGWVTTVVGAGWLLGDTVADLVGDVSSALSLLVLAAIVVLVVLRRRRRGAAEASTASS